MPKYKFILKFEDKEQTFSKENGLPLNTLSDLLSGLFEATKSSESSNMTLSEVQSNSYGLVVSTDDEYEFDSLKLIHNRISSVKDLIPYNKELKYLRALKKITDSGVSLESFDESKEFHVRITNVSDVDKERYVSEYQELIGTISEIGGNKILGKRHIRLDEYDYDIVVNSEQDDKLKYFYKEQRVLLYVKVKYDFNKNHKIRIVELLDFEPQSSKSLQETVNEFLKKKGEVFSEIFDSVQAIREIRKE